MGEITMIPQDVVARDLRQLKQAFNQLRHPKHTGADPL